MGLWSPSRLTTDVPSKPKSPAVPIPSPVPSEPAPWLAPGLGHVGRFDVYPVHQLCARGKPRALASLGFLTSKSGGLWRVCSRTSAMPLGRFHQRRLSDSSFARSVPTPGDGRSLVFRETGSDLPFLFRTPPPAETRDPPLRPSAGVGSPEVCRGFRM
jgi:hypothetical protein